MSPLSPNLAGTAVLFLYSVSSTEMTSAQRKKLSAFCFSLSAFRSPQIQNKGRTPDALGFKASDVSAAGIVHVLIRIRELQLTDSDTQVAPAACVWFAFLSRFSFILPVPTEQGSRKTEISFEGSRDGQRNYTVAEVPILRSKQTATSRAYGHPVIKASH